MLAGNKVSMQTLIDMNLLLPVIDVIQIGRKPQSVKEVVYVIL